jgi:Na+(H+)/acetate symporter ActP
MLAAVLYIGMNQPQVGKALGLAPGELRIWNIEPIAAGVLGVPIGFIFGILISYLSSFWSLGNKQAKAL